MTVQIHSMHIYPIKSCQGITLQSAELTPTGFKYDRHWMLVDPQGKFISQRTHPKLAQIKTTLTEQSLIAEFAAEQIIIPLMETDSDRITVTIWGDECLATQVSDDCNTWFSDILNTDCKLVFLPENQQRKVDPDYAQKNEVVVFADGFPLLLLSRASIDLLNQHLSEKNDINRFRANIIVDGCAAHAEDEWSSISVNGITISLPKPCSRCAIPGIDQQTGVKNSAILKALAGYRRRDNHVYFGQNAIHHATGFIATGQRVDITKKP